MMTFRNKNRTEAVMDQKKSAYTAYEEQLAEIATLRHDLKLTQERHMECIGERDKWLLKMQDFRAALFATHEALRAMCDFYGATHTEECPHDDTCDCQWKSFNEKIDAALKMGAYVMGVRK